MSLALVCGTGDLPKVVARAQDTAPLVCVLDGFEPEGLISDITFRIETIGQLLKDLAALQVREVCFCGAIQRPPVDLSALDALTIPLVPTIMQAMRAGDDGALRAVAAVFEEAGFTLRGAHELAPDLLLGEGCHSKAEPDPHMQQDAEKGFGILAALAPFDVAQACVVGGGHLLGVETLAGTDLLLQGVPDLPQRAMGVLVKGPKPGQDLRFDMPTIGPETVRAVHAAGLRGIVVQADGVIVLDREAVFASCDAHGLVLWSRA